MQVDARINAAIVARDLRVRLGLFVVVAHTYGLGKPPRLFAESELKHGIHGGTVETSLMLHLRPDLVHMATARNFAPLSLATERDCETLTPGTKVGFGWQTQDLHPDGACGDTVSADAARGAALLDYVASRLVQILAEVERFPLSALRPR